MIMTEAERPSSKNMALLQAKYKSETGLITHFALSRFYAALKRMLDQVQAETALDAGCGEGVILNQFLNARYPSVIGIDLDLERVSYAKATNQTSAVAQGNLHHIPLAAASVDVVLALEVLEHVGDPERALAELHRVTHKYVILSVPNEPFWRIGNMARGAYWRDWGNTPEHINHWSVRGFKRLVSPYFHVLDAATPVTWTMLLAEKRS